MRMMFAVGRLNRVRSKIVVAGRLRDAAAGSPLAGLPHPPGTPNQPVQNGTRSSRVDRAGGGRDPIPQGIGMLRDHEGGSRVH